MVILWFCELDPMKQKTFLEQDGCQANFHEYHIQHSLKLGGTKDHFRWVKIPGTAPY
jgi:hypothetical protein